MNIHRELKQHLIESLRQNDKDFHEDISAEMKKGSEQKEKDLVKFIEEKLLDLSTQSGANGNSSSHLAPEISSDERIKVKVIATGDVNADVELIFKAQDLGLTSHARSFFEEEKEIHDSKD